MARGKAKFPENMPRWGAQARARFLADVEKRILGNREATMGGHRVDTMLFDDETMEQYLARTFTLPYACYCLIFRFSKLLCYPSVVFVCLCDSGF